MPISMMFMCCTSVLPCVILASFFISVVIGSIIPLGSKISVVDRNFWISSNGDFALGFLEHSEQPNLYSVGIRFNAASIPVNKRTVVWVAGADSVVGNESYFQLNLQGELVLYDSSSRSVEWSCKTSNSSVTSARLHDSGNFVLMDGNENVVWQSFSNPSDTLLPGQNLSAVQELRAAGRTSMSSYYTLSLVEGQLKLNFETSITYWTGGESSDVQLTAVLNSSGVFQLFNEKFTPVWSQFADDHGDSVKFRFLKLDVDGNLRLYSWDDASVSWRPVWQAVENQCDVFATCGLRGICAYSSSGTPMCSCPFTSRLESSSDCLVPYRQDCASMSFMNTHEHTFLYGIYPPNNSFSITSLEDCRSLCKEDMLCTAVTYSNDGTAQCRMKRTRYVTGYSDPSLASVSFVKSCSDPTAVLPKNFSPSLSPSLVSTKVPRSHNRGLGIPSLIGAAAGTFCILTAVQIVVGIWLYKRRVSMRKKATSAYSGLTSAGLITLSLAEVKEITDNFTHQLGPCSFKGVLPDTRPVLIKQIQLPPEERKFRSIAAKVGRIYHKNLVKLEGYCSEAAEIYLAYEFMKHGSLERCLQSPKLCRRLTWKKRMEISLGVARAISYLHGECREFICHGDLNVGNVLLDENLEAKVSEFGLPRNATGAAEKDVKDYGSLVLTLFTWNQRSEGANDEWFYDKWISEQGGIVDNDKIEGEVDSGELERVLRIVFWCLQADERMRPSMGEVVKVLEGTLVVDLPPPPFARRRSSDLEELVENTV